MLLDEKRTHNSDPNSVEPAVPLRQLATQKQPNDKEEKAHFDNTIFHAKEGITSRAYTGPSRNNCGTIWAFSIL